MTHCGTCTRIWTGLAEAHCTTCHRHFTTTTAFDLHRVGPTDDRRCADPATLVRGDGQPRLSAVLRASGEVWGYPSGGEGRVGRQFPDREAGMGTPDSAQDSQMTLGGWEASR